MDNKDGLVRQSLNAMKTAFVGRWKITEMEQWDQDYVDMEEPGNIAFEKGGSGGFHFGCVDGSLDWRYDASIDRVDHQKRAADNRGTREIRERKKQSEISFPRIQRIPRLNLS